jgi:type II secretory pathway component GspD/PulD (secretin)
MVLALALLPLSLAARAQATDAKTSDLDCSKLLTHSEREDCTATHSQPHTIYLHNITGEEDASQIATAIRNSSDSSVRVYLLGTQNAIAVETYPAEFARIEALVRSLDRPRKAYRLTYTITELDSGKTIGTEHLSMVVVNGQHTSVKEGDKVPVATGSYSEGNATPNGVQTQFTYLDVGMNFDATLNEVEGGAVLKSKVEQSSLGQPSTIAGVQEPVVRQTVLEGISVLTLGKPVMLGSIDVPTTTHRFDIAVVLEQIK